VASQQRWEIALETLTNGHCRRLESARLGFARDRSGFPITGGAEPMRRNSVVDKILHHGPRPLLRKPLIIVSKVYDAVWSDDRQPGADGRLPPMGHIVDVANGTWSNSIGDPQLIAVWRAPDFDPALKAFYYARAIEIPTPR
jgi:hypothetical protein